MAQQKFLSKITESDVGGKAGCIRFVLGNGLEVQADVDLIPASIQRDLMLHGLSQKVGDSSAGFSKAQDFSGAFGAMQQVVDNLYSGIWSTRGQGGGVADLVNAIAELRGVSVEQAQAAVDQMDEEQLKKVASHPAVKAKVAEAKAMRLNAAAQNAPDLDDLLGDM
jgi:hypothetical protein